MAFPVEGVMEERPNADSHNDGREKAECCCKANRIGPVINVPALSLTSYDGGDYAAYPERQGWGIRSVAKWQELFQQPTPEFKAFLQRWLYYGLAYVVFDNIDIPNMPTMINRTQPDRPIIRTSSLADRMDQLLEQREATSIMYQAMKICGDALTFVGEPWSNRQRFGNALTRPECPLEFIIAEKPENSLGLDIMLSISLLWELSAYLTAYNQYAVGKDAQMNMLPSCRSGQCECSSEGLAGAPPK
ncbi:hypothetical protein BJX70DRAFT_397986 [Aspergillus crustosus]